MASKAKDVEIVNQATSLEVNKDAEIIIKDGFEKANISQVDPFIVLKDGLNASRKIIDKYGDEHTEPDFNARHKYMLTALELMRVLKPSNSNNVNLEVSLTNIVADLKSNKLLNDTNGK